MLRDCPALAAIVFEDEDAKGAKDTGNTILSKSYPGGVLSLVGANSGTGFRRVSRRVVAFDEVDGYPPSAGAEGDQIKLGIRRTEYFWNRKIIAGSTPLLAGHSRIEGLFEAGDQRRYYVPCPQCGHMDYFVFREAEQGHFMQWPDGKPEDAYFVCSKNGCEIEHKDKRQMVERGEWRASAPFAGHASFHVWAAYSYSPNATWGQLAQEFLAAKGNSESLKTFINTVLGETWKERGDAPDWERIYMRREPYAIGSLPEGVIVITAGVDVQKDRCVYEITGWGEGKESWSIESSVIPMDTSNEAEWVRLDALLERTWPKVLGGELSIKMLAIDSGFNTQMVYNWARRHPMSRVIAVKGVSTAKTLIGSPSSVDVTVRGKRLSRGYKIWAVGVDVAKSEFYGWLRLPVPNLENGEPYPSGFCHFPEYGEDYFKQITAEHLVSTVTRKGFRLYEWQLIPGRENHYLDCRVYARAAAALLGLDRMRPTKPVPLAAPVAAAQPVNVAPKPQTRPDSRFRVKSNPGSWLSKKR